MIIIINEVTAMNQVPKGLSAAALVATVAVSSVTQAQLEEVIAVSYTHMTLPTNRDV